MSALRGLTPYLAQADILAALTAALAPLAGAKVRLLKTPLLLTSATTLAECVAAEADYPGYVAGGVAVSAWQAPTMAADGHVRSDGQAMQFVANATTSSNTIYGAFLVNAGGTALMRTYAFDIPVVLGVDLLKAVDFQPSFVWDGSGGPVPGLAQAELLDALAAAAAMLDGAFLELIKEPLLLTASTTLAECVAAKADYTGYAAQEVTAWEAAKRGSDGLVGTDGVSLQFVASGTALSNTIYAAYLTNAAGNKLINVYALPVPVVLGVDLLNAVDVQPSVVYGQ